MVALKKDTRTIRVSPPLNWCRNGTLGVIQAANITFPKHDLHIWQYLPAASTNQPGIILWHLSSGQQIG